MFEDYDAYGMGSTVYVPSDPSTGTGITSGVGFGNVLGQGMQALGQLASVWGNVEIAKTRANTPTYFRGADGKLYMEGQRGVTAVAGQSVGGFSPVLILLAVGVAFLALKG